MVDSDDADFITTWAEDWKLGISVSKCNVLTFGKPSVYRKYYISDTELPPTTQCRDLGIVTTRPTDLSPFDHIHKITTKAHQCANNIEYSDMFCVRHY